MCQPSLFWYSNSQYLDCDYVRYSGDLKTDRPSLDFKWSKRGWVANGLDFEWHLKSGSPTI